jgi:hypothetical protein
MDRQSHIWNKILIESSGPVQMIFEVQPLFHDYDFNRQQIARRRALTETIRNPREDLWMGVATAKPAKSHGASVLPALQHDRRQAGFDTGTYLQAAVRTMGRSGLRSKLTVRAVRLL